MTQFPDDDLDDDLFTEQVLAGIDALEAAEDGAAGGAARAKQGGEEPPPPHYPNHIEWVVQWFSKMYAREVGEGTTDIAWCPWWLNHPEACSTFESMWRAWEHLRLDGKTGMSVWWRDHCNPHMTRLLDPTGTFRYCTVKGHFANGVLSPLPLASPGAVLSSPAVAGAGAVSTTTNGRKNHVGRLFARITGNH
ncbi:uncharacterized protein DUF4913 [Nocardia tenerifensis]|uniref:Uncharacterized protein DUF4913 n=1 Tax=Nocardia tenerifensis TaxID=228006 RepID=A0A318K0K1_9NOCA|nr:DUF4913 domain-containing protein [Nocardia tenerifensis]PXX52797.1 uncharacterized protein DUF4913 [Nocardia tenerifensis]